MNLAYCPKCGNGIILKAKNPNFVLYHTDYPVFHCTNCGIDFAVVIFENEEIKDEKLKAYISNKIPLIEKI